MSSIVKFFAGSEEDALRFLEYGPGEGVDYRPFGNFDAEEALIAWESILSGSSTYDLIEIGFPKILAEDDDGVAVVVLSERIARHLAFASLPQIRELVEEWSDREVIGRSKIDPSIKLEILQAVAELASEALRLGQAVYCWVA